MSRVFIMTLGLVLIFFGIQTFLIKSFILTPQASRFVAERFEAPQSLVNSSGVNNGYSPFNQASYYQSSYGQPNIAQTANLNGSVNFPQRSLSPPSWLCWPILFFGVVTFLHGLVLRRD